MQVRAGHCPQGGMEIFLKLVVIWLRVRPASDLAQSQSWLRPGSDLAQTWLRPGSESDLAQTWLRVRTASDLAQTWLLRVRAGSDLAQSQTWLRPGSESVNPVGLKVAWTRSCMDLSGSHLTNT